MKQGLSYQSHCSRFRKVKCAAEVSPQSNAPPMRRIILIRHADSEVQQPGVRDHDRPISRLGEEQAREIGSLLLSKGPEWFPDLVLASNSKRSKQTLQVMEAVCEPLQNVDTHLFGSLYLCNALDGQTREEIEKLVLEHADDKKHTTIAVLGHNKGMEEAASSMLCQAITLKSASAALIECAAQTWAELLGHHQSDLSRASRDEDWASHAGEWSLREILTPSNSN